MVHRSHHRLGARWGDEGGTAIVGGGVAVFVFDVSQSRQVRREGLFLTRLECAINKKYNLNSSR